MPYTVPSSPSTSSPFFPTTLTPTTVASPRLSHRRTRSCSPSFSDEQVPGAFISLGSLPKRKPSQKKAMFHFNEEPDQQEEVKDNDSTQKSHPSLFLSLPTAQDSVPFPSSSSLPPPLSFTDPRNVMRSPTPRKAPSPIILFDGKPLKPSLKSSSSSPHIPQIAHIRAQSTPVTPNLLKNVRFAEYDDGLESVRVFNRSGKPARISWPPGEKTESETETEPAHAFPFPRPPITPPQSPRLPRRVFKGPSDSTGFISGQHPPDPAPSDAKGDQAKRLKNTLGLDTSDHVYPRRLDSLRKRRTVGTGAPSTPNRKGPVDGDLPSAEELLSAAINKIFPHDDSPQSLPFVDGIRQDPAKSTAPDNLLGAQGAGYWSGNRSSCLKGTRESLLHEIYSWAEDFTQSPILWLNGLAGTGKSTIAQTVAEWRDARCKLGSSFFCSRNTGNHGNLCVIFPALAIQLARKHGKVQSVLTSLLQSNPDVVYESASDQVEKLIVKPLRVADVPTLIIIDALDEWMDDASQSNIISALERWIKEIPKVKFLVTSRPETHILTRFHTLPLSGLASTLALHDITPHLVDEDIRLFFEDELSRLAPQNWMLNWPTAEQLDLLCARSAGLFVYAVATTKFLSSNNTSPREQYAIIAHSPDDTTPEGTKEGAHRGLSLDSLCISVLRGSFKDNDDEDDAIVRSILATVVLVTHPLPLPTIAALTGLEAKEVMSILQSIRSLVRLDQHVRPFHELLSDLLVSPTRCVDERFYISPGKFDSEIALNCLKIMNETLEDGVQPQNRTANSDVECPFEGTALGYACTSWHVHLAEAREDISALIPTLRRFLDEKVTAWLKALGTSGAVTDPALVLNKTIFWLRKVAKDDRLLDAAERCLLSIKRDRTPPQELYQNLVAEWCAAAGPADSGGDQTATQRRNEWKQTPKPTRRKQVVSA